MSALLVDGKLVTDKGEYVTCGQTILRHMVPHRRGWNLVITNCVKEMFKICVEDPSGVLNEPLVYEEVARVCFKLNLGVSSVLINYEHTRFWGPSLWQHLFH